MDAFRILAISGSLRRGSYNTAALRVAQNVAPEGVEIEIADISQIPIYNEDVKAAGLPAVVEALCGRIATADAVLISTPEYNYSVPGVLKNAIDWISRAPKQPFDGKPIAIMGASPGAIGTARAQYDLRKTFVFLNGHVLNRPEVMISAAATRFDAEGRLTDEATRGFIRTLVQALRDWSVRLHT